MLETGIDIIEIARFDKLVSKAAFMNKYFHPAEIDYVKRSAHAAQHLAVRFAAKEAVRKVLLSYVDTLSWKDSWIENDQNGKPYLHFSEKIKEKIGIRHASVSLSHTDSTAIAIVIIDLDI
ncbi:MAG: holo-ACP synthase [Candidatus Marinimicrobia bacterium]|nr:holo-ACP synthase [Candidatus Neomarinimicrobiota bacterium]